MATRPCPECGEQNPDWAAQCQSCGHVYPERTEIRQVSGTMAALLVAVFVVGLVAVLLLHFAGVF